MSCEVRRCCRTLGVRRRRTSPPALGRTPPQGFSSGMSLAPASQGPLQGGRLPVAELSTHRTRVLLKRLLSERGHQRPPGGSPLGPGAYKGLNWRSSRRACFGVRLESLNSSHGTEKMRKGHPWGGGSSRAAQGCPRQLGLVGCFRSAATDLWSRRLQPLRQPLSRQLVLSLPWVGRGFALPV